MAITSAVQTLLDGPANTHVLLTGSADAAGNIAPVVFLDVSTLSPPAAKVKLKRAEWSVNGGSVNLYWKTAVGQENFLNLSGQGCMEPDSGIHNTADGLTGDVSYGTTGFDAGSNYSVLLEFRK